MGMLGTLFDAVIFGTAIKVIDKSSDGMFREHNEKEKKETKNPGEHLFKW